MTWCSQRWRLRASSSWVAASVAAKLSSAPGTSAPVISVYVPSTSATSRALSGRAAVLRLDGTVGGTHVYGQQLAVPARGHPGTPADQRVAVAFPLSATRIRSLVSQGCLMSCLAR